MRDFQSKVNIGGLPDSTTITKHGAGEFNAAMNELENSVLRSGLPLAGLADGTGDDTTQLAQSLFIHGTKSTSFQDSGAANAYILTPISGPSGVKLPPDYSAMDGSRVSFVPSNPNNAASTLDIGQTAGTLLGAKALLSKDGSPLSGGEILSDRVEAVYDSSADGGSGAWLLAPWSQPQSTGGVLVNSFHQQVVATESTTSTAFVTYTALGTAGVISYAMNNPANSLYVAVSAAIRAQTPGGNDSARGIFKVQNNIDLAGWNDLSIRIDQTDERDGSTLGGTNYISESGVSFNRIFVPNGTNVDLRFQFSTALGASRQAIIFAVDFTIMEFGV